MGRLSPPGSVTGFKIKFIGNWTVLLSGDLGELGLIQNKRSLNWLFVYECICYIYLTFLWVFDFR